MQERHTSKLFSSWTPTAGVGSPVVLVLRIPLILFLWIHLYLQLTWLSPAFLVVSAVIATACGAALGTSPLRNWIGVALVLALPWIIHGGVSLGLAIQRSISPGPQTDTLVLLFDRNYVPSVIPFVITALGTLLFVRIPRYRLVDAGVNALLLGALFWNQAFHELTIYETPSGAMAAIAGFVLYQVLLLVLAQRLDRRRGQKPATGHDAHRHRGRRRHGGNLLGGVAAVLLLLATLGGVVGFFFTRYSADSVTEGGAGLMRESLFRFDFSDFVSLESNITMDDDMVLLYRRDGRPSRDLLRRFVLSAYTPQRGFFRDSSRPADPVSPEEVAGRSLVEQDYFLINLEPSALLGLNAPVSHVYLENWQDSSFIGMYRVDSLVPGGPEADFSTADLSGVRLDTILGGVTEEFRSHYLDFGNDELVAQLAREVVDGRDGPYAAAKRIEQYLKANYYYSLSPGISAGGNQLHHFLFDSQKGYCSYFAFAMALMLRSLDIPARVAVGFFALPEFSVMNMYPVRSDMAHAWVEVYFGEYGWIEFDPTSQTPAPGETLPFSFNTNSNEILSLLEEVLRQGSIDELPEVAGPSTPVGRNMWEQIGRRLTEAANRWYIWIPLLYIVIVLATRAPLLPLLVARARGDQRNRVLADFRRLGRRLGSLGVRRRAGESITDFAKRVQADRGLQLVDAARLVQAARFSPPADAREAASAPGGAATPGGSGAPDGAGTQLSDEHRRTAFVKAIRSLRALPVVRRIAAIVLPTVSRGRPW